MKSEAEIQKAIYDFQRAISLRLDQIESLDATDRFYLVKQAKLEKQIKELEIKMEALKWAITT